jgi:molybdopterin-containing oxidoreductase family iron-sulfur binding subunit
VSTTKAQTDRPRKWGMAVDLDRCAGCWSCGIACKAENNIPIGLWWNRIANEGAGGLDTPEGTYPHLNMGYIPIACQHCEEAPCTKVCPARATYKREDGIVVQDWDRCIGCRYCMAACPYGARVFNWGEPERIPAFDYGSQKVSARPKGTVEKCTLCVHRIDEGRVPACVESCPLGARIFGDLNDPESSVNVAIRERSGHRLLEDKGTRPHVYYLPERRKQKL